MAIRQRSPNYPGIDLSEAIEVLKRLYPKVQRGEFTINDAAIAVGYSSVSGPIRRKIGALKQYGLIDQKKGDNAKLSTKGLTICLRNPASQEYRAAIRDAALEPPLFKEFFDTGKHTSSDDVLRQELVVNRGFTDDGATLFVQVLRTSLAFANPTDSDKISGQEQDKQEEEGENDMSTSTISPALDTKLPATSGSSRSIQIPYTLNAWAKLEAAFPMSEENWTQMMAVLIAMKPGLVKGPSPAEATDSKEGHVA